MIDTQHGYLLLADISGYTSYVASTELTHSQEILSELLELNVSTCSSSFYLTNIFVRTAGLQQQIPQFSNR